MQTDNSDQTGHPVAKAAREEKLVGKNLNLHYDYSELFVYSQCLPAWLLLVLRLIMGCICTGVFLYMTIRSPFVNFGPSNSTDDSSETNGTTEHPATFKRHFYLCYLTIWSYLVITVYFNTALINTISMWISGCQSDDFSVTAGGFKSTDNLLDRSQADVASRAPVSCSRQFGFRLQWLLCGVAANAAILVTVAYFGVLYPMIRAVNPSLISPVDLFVHGFNSVFMFLEIVCSGVPVRMVHVLYTAVYGLSYALFSVFYWIPDHSNVIYPILLDWNNAGRTIGILCLLLVVGLPIIQLFWWLIYLARCFLADKVVTRSRDWSPGLHV